MPETAIILGPRDFDRLILTIREQVSQEFANLKGMVVEKPISTKEAADYLNIHYRTLYQRIKTGLPYHEDHGSMYFFPSELNAYIKSKKR